MALAAILAVAASASGQTFPDWAFHVRLWPFDIVEPETTDGEIADRLDAAVSAGADSTIVYVEQEHMYRSFVDDDGWGQVLGRLGVLVTGAHDRGLRVVVYLNGLEVMARDAVDPVTCAPTSVPTMARTHPDWLQVDLEGRPIVYTCVEGGWLTADMEDAWVSPFSPYRDLFCDRIADLGPLGVDAVYIDATFLPGFQPDEADLRWGTTDPAARTDFIASTGFAPPAEVDLDDPAFRAWLTWRHGVVRDYLADLAAAAWTAGVVPFWESSSNDTPAGTLLGNETAVTATNPMGFSPEVEPEGDWLAAFRMMKAARDFAPDQPLLYLGWPESLEEARLQLATALAFSANLYPTADAPYPAEPYAFADSIRETLLRSRRPHDGHVALVYSVRNKDWTFEDGEHFAAYDDVFRDLVRAHVPFRVVVLEHLTAEALAPFDTVVLPHLPSISDAEHTLLAAKAVVVVDEVGTRDESWQWRQVPLDWPSLLQVAPGDLDPGLPFRLDAPESTWVAFYRDGAGGYLLFAVHGGPGGVMTLSADEPLEVEVHGPGFEPLRLAGTEVEIPMTGELTVLHVKARSTTQLPRRVRGRLGRP